MTNLSSSIWFLHPRVIIDMWIENFKLNIYIFRRLFVGCATGNESHKRYIHRNTLDTKPKNEFGPAMSNLTSPIDNSGLKQMQIQFRKILYFLPN